MYQAALKPSNFITHLGQVHSQVEKYLPDYAKIPALVGRRSVRLEPVTVRKNHLYGEWPEPPEGFNPVTREIPEVCPGGFFYPTI